MSESEASNGSVPARSAPNASNASAAGTVPSDSARLTQLTKELEAMKDKNIAVQTRCFYLEGQLTTAIANAQKSDEYVQVRAVPILPARHPARWNA